MITLLIVRLYEGAKAHAESTQMKSRRAVNLNILQKFFEEKAGCMHTPSTVVERWMMCKHRLCPSSIEDAFELRQEQCLCLSTSTYWYVSCYFHFFGIVSLCLHDYDGGGGGVITWSYDFPIDASIFLSISRYFSTPLLRSFLSFFLSFFLTYMAPHLRFILHLKIQ